MAAIDRFDTYYGTLFGERWAGLRVALVGAGAAVAWDSGLTQPYHLDIGSVAVAHLLPLEGAHEIADLCAAPGGKALVIAARMGGAATLVANERSAARRARLHRVLDDHLPPEVRTRVTVSGHDAARWGLARPAAFDAILADVPCSSERHVLAQPRELAQWSPTRARRNATLQRAILAAAIDALRPGGVVLYATCALSPTENDAVVERITGRRPCRIEPIAPDAVARWNVTAEATTHGIHILPDASRGAGPLYAALIRRLPAPRGTSELTAP